MTTELDILQKIDTKLEYILGLMILYSFYLVFKIVFNFFAGIFKFI